MNPRRVVTGHNAGGRAVVVLDEIVHPVTIDLLPGNAWHLLGGADKILTFPNDGSDAPTRSYFPSVGGFRFRFITFPPDGAQPARDTVDRDAALREFEEKLPGMAAHMEPEHPGMHTTGTVDCGMIIAGEITLELDDGLTVNLKAATPLCRTARGIDGRTRVTRRQRCASLRSALIMKESPRSPAELL